MQIDALLVLGGGLHQCWLGNGKISWMQADTTGTNITAFYDSSQGLVISARDGVDTVANYQASFAR